MESTSKSCFAYPMPIKLIHSSKFIDIASHDSYISSALSTDGLFYVWGQCGKELITKPKETDFKSFNDIFGNYSRITYKPIEGSFIQFSENFITDSIIYEIEFNEIEKLGEGSYGEVFRVKDIHDDSYFAVKKINLKPINEN